MYNGEYGVATDENGLYYMRARYYNSEIKRFINQDVVIGSITESPSMNRYAYVQGNPISLSDPFGLSPSINWSLAGHALLDLLGLIPGVGVVFDVANMIWYIAEGDAFGAICSFISALPCIGEVAGALMAGTKLAKLNCSVVKITKMAAHVGSIGKSMYVIGNVVRNNVEKYIINGEDFDPKQFAVDLVTVGMEGFAIGGAIKGLKNIETTSCFVAGTAVLTAEGHKAIEEIKPGDMVLAENPKTGDVEYKEVLETYENETEELIHVHVDGEDIVTTPSHPFYVNKFGWTRAAQLRAGDVLVLSNGEYVVVEFIQHEILESPVKVYNFEVEDFHTYFVGESSVLVHNMCVAKGTLASNDVFEVDPKQVNFSQRTVSGNVEPYTQDMINGNWTWNDNNTIRVMGRDVQLVTYDNRRLMAAQNAGLDTIPVKIVQGTDAFPDSTTGRTWDDAFVRRFNDKRNKKAGGVVPNTGLFQQPSIATATGGGK